MITVLYSYDSYKLYLLDSVAKGSARVKVTMKEPVNPQMLRRAIDAAIKRYPYFAVRLSVDSYGGFVLSPNESPVVLVETSDRMPALAGPEANGHLLFADYRGNNIYFNISHSLAGAKGYMRWVFTTVCAYVRECYGVIADAPEISCPESPVLPGEWIVPTQESIPWGAPAREPSARPGTLVLMEDVLQEYLNPMKRSQEYRTWQFEEKQVLAYARENRTTVSGTFLMLMAKMLDRVLPDTVTPLCGGILHNPTANWGLPCAHSDISTHVFVDYDRAMIRGDDQAMGAYTSDQLKQQTDPSYTACCFGRYLDLLERIDRTVGHDAKRACAREGMRAILSGAAPTYVVSYGGLIRLGGLGDYVDAYYSLIEGNMTLTLTAMEGKIFAALIQNIREEKYVQALNDVFDRAGFRYRMQGPFRQRLAVHHL